MGKDKKLDALLYYIVYSPDTYSMKIHPQMGLYYLAQYANDNGFKVKVDTLPSNSSVVKSIAENVNDFSCKVVGFYVDNENIWILPRIFSKLQAVIPDCLIIVGGPQVTGAPIDVLKKLPEAICGVIGEGEVPFCEILASSEMLPKTLKRIDGLVIRENDVFFSTPTVGPVNCASLSFPRRAELSVSGVFNFSPTLITARGCIGRCRFCFEGTDKKKGGVRYHDIGVCLDELDNIIKQCPQCNFFSISDDAFICNTERVEQFCNTLIDRYSGELKWYCEARADTLHRRMDLLPLLKDAGLIRLQIGGESGSQEILDAYKKGTTLEQLKQVVSEAYRVGINSVYANFIIGGAHETKHTFNQTLDFSIELLKSAPGCMEVGASIFTPYVGTAMRENPESYGLIIEDLDGAGGIDGEYPYCRTIELSRADIINLNHRYKREVGAVYRDLCNHLSKEIITHHFEAYYKYGLNSQWHRVLSRVDIYQKYFRSLFLGKAKTFTEIEHSKRNTAIPFRIYKPINDEEGRCIEPGPAGQIRVLDPISQALVGLSSGKLSYGDIISILGKAGNNAHVVQQINRAFTKFDQGYMIVWKE